MSKQDANNEGRAHPAFSQDTPPPSEIENDAITAADKPYHPAQNLSMRSQGREKLADARQKIPGLLVETTRYCGQIGDSTTKQPPMPRFLAFQTLPQRSALKKTRHAIQARRQALRPQ